jgi:hypothetical protein
MPNGEVVVRGCIQSWRAAWNKPIAIIILNEMDIGMVRTYQQHMTWQMAYSLGMNFAWVLEFVELTIGDKQDS